MCIGDRGGAVHERVVETAAGWLRLRAGWDGGGVGALLSASFVTEADDGEREERDNGALGRVLDDAGAAVDRILGGGAVGRVRMSPGGTRFQRRVWAALRRIPRGETVSYGELARRLGCPGGARAVGLANARNPIAVLIPCHRVVASDGTLHGYAGGLARKRALLGLEGALAGVGRAENPTLFRTLGGVEDF